MKIYVVLMIWTTDTAERLIKRLTDFYSFFKHIPTS